MAVYGAFSFRFGRQSDSLFAQVPDAGNTGSVTNDATCTALDQDWGEAQPNILMHPPCVCARCAPLPSVIADDSNWLQIGTKGQRFRVELTVLGSAGRTLLG